MNISGNYGSLVRRVTVLIVWRVDKVLLQYCIRPIDSGYHEVFTVRCYAIMHPRY